MRQHVADLRRAGLRVFMDENIPAAESITGTIEQALRDSKVFLAYYSAGYPSRPACQFELTAAFLAGQREGDPMRRIVVVNPEPGTEHLYPVQLADAKFLRPPGRISEFVDAVRAWVDAVDGAFGDIRFAERPRWYAERLDGAFGFVGRYREQWLLHDALHRADYPLITEATSGPVAALVGIAGSGKSTFTAAYAWQFGSAYPGGVYWTSLIGATAPDALARYGDELRRVASQMEPRLAVDGSSRADIAAAIANRIFTDGRPALWVVDDVPPDIDHRVLEQLVIKAGGHLRTVLISRRGPYRELATVELGRMSPDDAGALLRAYREPDRGDDDRAALDALVERLDGHAFSLRHAGRLLRDRQGLHSYVGLVERLAADPTVLDPATALVRDAIIGLDGTQRLIMQLATVCAPTGLPARLISGVTVALRGDRADPAEALIGLRERLLTTRLEDRWQFHAIVLDAARRYLPPGEPPRDLVRAAAQQVLSLAANGPADPVIPHAAALSEHGELDDATVETLLRLLVRYFTAQGEPLLAAGRWDRLLTRSEGTVEDLLAAASVHVESGGYEQGIEYAQRARRLSDPGDAAGLDADRLTAQALDLLGRLGEAEPHWSGVSAASTVSARLAYIRSRRLRGELRVALDQATSLVAELRADPVAQDDLQAAQIELATIQVSSNAQQEARLTAEAVLRHYQQRQLPEHSQALAAQALLAQAWLTLHLLELRPDPSKWQDAAESLRELGDRLRRTHGPLNPRTLTTDLEYGYALLCLGRPTQADRQITATLARLRQRFDPNHPLILRAGLLLGRAQAQRGDHVRAKALHETAYAALRATLGPCHPDTLQAEYGLGVALVLTGERTRGAELLAEVRRLAPSSVGRKTDLYAQSVAACALLVLPGGVWRFVDRMTNGQPRPDDEKP